jgi:hypothetical protein
MNHTLELHSKLKYTISQVQLLRILHSRVLCVNLLLLQILQQNS